MACRRVQGDPAYARGSRPTLGAVGLRPRNRPTPRGTGLHVLFIRTVGGEWWGFRDRHNESVSSSRSHSRRW